jgi:hypothetical protein
MAYYEVAMKGSLQEVNSLLKFMAKKERGTEENSLHSLP